MKGLSLQGVCKRFGGVTAADEITLDVPAGRVTGLIGPNGAGKTTIVNLITGMLALSAGRIEFDGRDISALGADRISRLGFARTFQNIRLFKEASVVDNLLIGFHKLQQSSLVSNILGLPAARAETARIRAMAHDLLQRFDMSRFADFPAGGLSYGHQRRVEMMRALAASPTVLLLDEPASGLNHEEVGRLGELIRDLRSRLALTVLLVEHHMNLVMSICDRVVALNFGRRIAEGAPDEVRAHPELVRAYLGAA